MVLLRIAIGWHVCYEGISKLQSLSSATPFSAETYLRYSQGPQRDYFRALVEDFDGLKTLDLSAVKSRWKSTVAKYADHYQFNSEERAQVDAKLTALTTQAEKYLSEAATEAKIKKYRDDAKAWHQADKVELPEFQHAEQTKAHLRLDATRRELTGPIVGWTNELESELRTIAAKRDAGWRARFDDVQFWWHNAPQLDKANMITMWGLAVFGGCMVLGLFSRLSALGTAVLLSLFYLAMPPLPGLPPSPVAEGTYLIVNKTLIELIACLMLATVPTGVWGGLDALLRGLITRPIFGVGAKPR